MQLAGCIIKDQDGKILLLHRNTPKRTQWEIPGGKLDPGETPQQAAIRELAEELDLEVKIVRQIGSKTFQEDDANHEYHWFEAKITERQPRLAEPDKFDKLAYFSIEEMNSMADELSPNTKNFIAASQVLWSPE